MTVPLLFILSTPQAMEGLFRRALLSPQTPVGAVLPLLRSLMLHQRALLFDKKQQQGSTSAGEGDDEDEQRSLLGQMQSAFTTDLLPPLQDVASGSVVSASSSAGGARSTDAQSPASAPSSPSPLRARTGTLMSRTAGQRAVGRAGGNNNANNSSSSSSSSNSNSSDNSSSCSDQLSKLHLAIASLLEKAAACLNEQWLGSFLRLLVSQLSAVGAYTAERSPRIRSLAPCRDIGLALALCIDVLATVPSQAPQVAVEASAAIVVLRSRLLLLRLHAALLQLSSLVDLGVGGRATMPLDLQVSAASGAGSFDVTGEQGVSALLSALAGALRSCLPGLGASAVAAEATARHLLSLLRLLTFRLDADELSVSPVDAGAQLLQFALARAAFEARVGLALELDVVQETSGEGPGERVAVRVVPGTQACLDLCALLLDAGRGDDAVELVLLDVSVLAAHSRVHSRGVRSPFDATAFAEGLSRHLDARTSAEGRARGDEAHTQLRLLVGGASTVESLVSSLCAAPAPASSSPEADRRRLLTRMLVPTLPAVRLSSLLPAGQHGNSAAATDGGATLLSECVAAALAMHRALLQSRGMQRRALALQQQPADGGYAVDASPANLLTALSAWALSAQHADDRQGQAEALGQGQGQAEAQGQGQGQDEALGQVDEQEQDEGQSSSSDLYADRLRVLAALSPFAPWFATLRLLRSGLLPHAGRLHWRVWGLSAHLFSARAAAQLLRRDCSSAPGRDSLGRVDGQRADGSGTSSMVPLSRYGVRGGRRDGGVREVALVRRAAALAAQVLATLQ